MKLTLWIVKSEVAGVPLRKGPAWRSTRSERGFVYFGGLWVGGFCGFELFCFFLEIWRGFVFFSHFSICPKTPDQSGFQEIFWFKGCSCFPHEKCTKLFGQDPRLKEAPARLFLKYACSLKIAVAVICSLMGEL